MKEAEKKNKIIVTMDGLCIAPQSVAAQHGIYVFNLYVRLSDEEYEDNAVDITQEQMFAQCREQGLIVHTAAVTTFDYLSQFVEFCAEGYDVLHVNIAHTISACYNNSKLAIKLLKRLGVAGRVVQVDSGQIAYGLLMLAIEAKACVQRGMSLDEIAAYLEEKKRHIRTSVFLATPAYMNFGGRAQVPPDCDAAFLDLTISPNPALVVAGSGKGQTESLIKRFIYNQVERFVPQDTRCCLSLSMVDEPMLQCATDVLQTVGFRTIVVERAACVLAAHLGPGSFALSYYGEAK